MLRKYKHISFDLDETLIHTDADYRYWLIPFVVKKLGGETPDKKMINEFWFEANRDETIAEKFGLNPENFWQLLKKIDTPQRRSRFTFANNDVFNCLWRLHKQGKLISIITGSPLPISKMATHKLKDAPVDFYLATTAHPELITKPHPSGMYYVLARLNVSAFETVYVGNSEEDWLFAKNSGVDFIYLERYEHNFSFKKRVVAVIKSLDELR